LRLEYRPYAGYTGGDGLRYAVQYPSARRAIAVNVTVRAEGAPELASQPIALDAPPQQATGPVPPCADLLF
jgi:hypothetical protein